MCWQLSAVSRELLPFLVLELKKLGAGLLLELPGIREGGGLFRSHLLKAFSAVLSNHLQHLVPVPYCHVTP